jgi:hypothetical protein|tara:strand:+ start:499 stop:759 length:261 start_codon:yes stop_codon:yes gene_type:complete
MGKAKVKIMGEKVEIDRLDLSKLTVDCHGVEYISENNLVFTDVVRSHTMADIFDLYFDEGKKINKIWILGGKLNPKLAEPELAFKD